MTQHRIDVFYGRTDNTRGYKEFTAVVVSTSETRVLEYYDDLYEPRGCDYKVLFEVPMNYLPTLCARAEVKEPNGPQWVRSPLKEIILEYWKQQCSNN